MRHIKHYLLTMLVALVSSVQAFAYDFVVDGIYYTVLSKEENTCEVDNKGMFGTYSGDLVIPSMVSYSGIEYKVVAIGEQAFSERFITTSKLISVSLPNTIFTIKNQAFACCEKLKEIKIPDSVTKIGSSAFWGCKQLKSVVIPDSVDDLGYGVFHDCDNLSSVTLGISVKKLGGSIFKSDQNLKKIISKKPAPPSCYLMEGYEQFDGVPKTECVIFVPEEAVEKYKSADGWKDFWNIKAIGSVIDAETISLNNTSITLNIGETETLTATVSPENTTDKTVEWSSSDENVATVSSSGVVTALKEGTATITAICGDASATCEVTVKELISDDNYNDYLSFRETGYSKMQIGASITMSISFELVNNGEESIELTKLVIKNKNTGTQVTSSEDASLLGTLNPGEKNALSVTVYTDDPMAYEYYYRYKGNLCLFNSADEVLAKSVTLDKTSETIYVGETLSLAATVFPWSTTNNKITWTSSDESVATVSAKGEVTAVAKGNVTITASTTDGSEKSASCEVTVLSREAESVTLNKTELTMKIGETESLTATVLPENTLDKTVTWTTSDEKVAAVDTDGVVTAVAVGTATITATCGSVSATCAVTVNPVLVESITLNYTSIDLTMYETVTLVATITPETATNKDVVWSSSNEDVAIVSNTGKVVPVSFGKATITATAADGSGVSATCEINVVPTMVESIELNYTAYDLQPGETLQLEAVVLPENATNKEVVWSSSNEDVVIVSSTGKVVFVDFGDATVTATAADGSGISATCVFSNVDGIEMITVNSGNVEVFTLDGKKVQNAGKGVYIINGKKVMK